jgi:hypothetical protein
MTGSVTIEFAGVILLAWCETKARAYRVDVEFHLPGAKHSVLLVARLA